MNTSEQYRELIKAFVTEYFNRRAWQVENNFLVMLPHNENRKLVYTDPLSTPFGQQLVEIARAAAGDIKDDEEGFNRGVVYEGIQDLMEQLFAPPGLFNTYTIPASFWEHPLGQMVNLAWLWVQQDKAIAQAQAAEILGLSINRIGQLIGEGKLRKYVDPDAPERQGRTLVSLKDVEKLKAGRD